MTDHPLRLVAEYAEDPVLTPGEVATLFRVDPKTILRWALAGKLSTFRTLGGQRRFRESEIRALLERKADDNE